MDQSVATFAVADRPWRTSHRPRRPLGIKLIVSLWLHLTLLALLLVTVRYQRLQEELPPPATVAVVFEGGQPQGPAVPEPRPPVALPAEPPAPPPALPPAPPPAVAPVLPTPPQPTAPPQVALLPPPPLPPAVLQPPLPTPPIPPALLQPAPPAPPAPLAPDQPRPDSVPPRPPPPVAVQPPPRQTAPAQRPPPSPPVVTPRPAAPNGFPTPMDFSFNRTPAAPSRDAPRPPSRTGSRSPSTLDFTLAPREGATDSTPFSRLAGMRMGPDWRNELSAWVRKHAYYPPQAAMNGEDGSAMVQVVVQPNGHVTSVELERKSGSKWLDIALVALFRDADLPPLHGETEPLTFHFTMNYILIRVQ